MGSYWSVEECGWVEHVAAPEHEVVVVAEQRAPEDEQLAATHAPALT